MNKIVAGIFASAMILGAPSCGNDFLEEDAGHKVSDALLETSEGVKALVGDLYAGIRMWGAFEYAYATTLYGCDEFTVAGSNNSEPWNDYTSNFGPLNWKGSQGDAKNNPGVDEIWNNAYFGIATANLLISSESKMPADIHDRALGEAYFLRGYNYLRLFGQYGAVALQTTPPELVGGGTVQRNYTRATEEETMNLIIDDLKKAYELIPANNNWVYYAWTKYTAAHFYAKALLFRQSERCSSWNGAYNAKADLDLAIQLCDEVIANRPLEQNYVNLYGHWTGVNCDAEKSKEILMAAPHDDISKTQGRFQNRTFPMFNPQFSNFSGNYVKRGQYIGLDFQRCRPTEYTYNTFDNVNDSRLWKSFRTVYGYNYYQKPDQMEKDGCPQGKMPSLGDPGILFILNKKGDEVASKYGKIGRAGEAPEFVYPEGVGKAENWYGKWVPNVLATYDGDTYEMDQHGVSGDPNTCNFYCGINKVEDGTRTGEKEQGHRDQVLARTGETYLIKAECQVRNGDDAGALATINQLRARAEYKAGEDREAYEDGTQAFANGNPTASTDSNCVNEAGKIKNQQAHTYSYVTTNTYCISTGLSKPEGGWGASDLQISSWGNLPQEDKDILSKLGVDAGSLEGKIHFILNERTRELLGEWNRFEELSRTKTLVKRAKAFNLRAEPYIQDRHNLRPIPQTFIDALQDEEGHNLSDAEKAAWQNPGY